MNCDAEYETQSTGNVRAPATLTSSSRLEMHASPDDSRLSERRKTVSYASSHTLRHDHDSNFGTKHDNPWGDGTRYSPSQLIDRSRIRNS